MYKICVCLAVLSLKTPLSVLTRFCTIDLSGNLDFCLRGNHVLCKHKIYSINPTLYVYVESNYLFGLFAVNGGKQAIAGYDASYFKQILKTD